MHSFEHSNFRARRTFLCVHLGIHIKYIIRVYSVTVVLPQVYMADTRIISIADTENRRNVARTTLYII